MSEHRILHVSVRADHGGGPRHLELLLRHAPEHVINHVACPRERPYWDRFADHVGASRMVELAHRSVSVRALAALAAYVIRHRIDVIHTHGKGAGLYGRAAACLTGRPTVHTPHGIHIQDYGRIRRALYRFYENASSSVLVRDLLYVSGDEQREALAAGLWQGRRAFVIPNGVEFVECADDPAHTRRQFGLGESGHVVTTISRFDAQKNMHEALEVAALRPEATFLWIGDGPQRGELEAEAIRRGIRNVIFAGVLEDPGRLLAVSDAYLSTSRWEGLPLAVLEAMSHGLPVVASDIGGHREPVGDSAAGFLYRCGEPEMAAALLWRLACDRALAQQLGDNARRTQAVRYDAGRMASAVYAVLTDDAGVR